MILVGVVPGPLVVRRLTGILKLAGISQILVVAQNGPLVEIA